MAKKNTLVIVLGYGCHLTEPMKNYLDAVVSFVATNDVAAIVVTGGYTNRKSAPEISEAEMMVSYLKKCGIKVHIRWEAFSLTTNQNLRSVGQLVNKLQMVNIQCLNDARIVIFCDDARSFKVRVLTRLILGRWPEVRTHELTKGLVAKLKQIFFATPLDVLASQFPFFERIQLRRKERIINNS